MDLSGGRQRSHKCSYGVLGKAHRERAAANKRIWAPGTWGKASEEEGPMGKGMEDGKPGLCWGAADHLDAY